MNFDFQSAGRIAFGPGRAKTLGPHLQGLGQSALLVTGRSAARAALAEEQLTRAGIRYEIVRAVGEPTIEQAREAVLVGRDLGAEFVICWGGGSAIDLGKAAAALIPAPADALEYLEVIGAGRPLSVPALPTIAVPTTAGTGAEVTRNAVLSSRQERVKVSLRHESMLPRLALVDPELTWGLPAATTAATGLDALTQCLEPFVSCQHNPLTDALALEGLGRGARSLARAVEDGNDPAARVDMALCSLFGGLALANAKLGAVHGFAAPLGGLFESPHGAVCARLLPVVVEVNVRALRARLPSSPLIDRFARVARILTQNPNANADDAVVWLHALGKRLGVPALAEYGVTTHHIPALVDKAARASSMQGNPIALEREELVEILERCL